MPLCQCIDSFNLIHIITEISVQDSILTVMDGECSHYRLFPRLRVVSDTAEMLCW